MSDKPKCLGMGSPGGSGGPGGGDTASWDGVYKTPIGVMTNPSGVFQDWVDLHFPPQDPIIQISANPAFGLREVGNDVVNPQIEGRGTLGSNPPGTLTLLELFRGNTGGVNLVPNEVNPTPGTWYTRTDTFTVSANQTYTARISDDQARNDTASGGYTFIFPFYWGVVDENTDIFDGITQAQILALAGMNKYIQTVGTKVVTTSPTNERYCFMYPFEYGALTSILDDLGYETISDYNTQVCDVIGLNGVNHSYRVYIFDNITTQVDFTNTYYF